MATVATATATAFSRSVLLPFFIQTIVLSTLCFADDPYSYNYLTYSYKTISPLGVPQKVIVVNDQFPGPLINATTNNNVVIDVKNKLDEDLLVTWVGIQMKQNPWQDGVQGTNCAIPPGRNFTYQFQVKDQIGSFFYFPSINFQGASGGYGPIIINNRVVIPIPFSEPDGDINIMIGDWYKRNHTSLRAKLDSGKGLGMPDGVLINGKGPYQYNSSVPDGIEYETIKVDPGKTYRIRVHNVGISTSLNFRIQSHSMLLVETEGYYTTQQNYSSFDIHVGQSYSFLVSMDQNASSDYYIVASARFVNQTVWQRVTGVAILHYSNSKGKASGPLPDPPNDEFDKTWSLNQAKSVRQNGSASGARPNPQGSFHYGEINVTNVYKLQMLPPSKINGKRRATLNGISFVNPETPITLADEFNVKDDYKMEFPLQPLSGAHQMKTYIIKGTFRGFVEIVLQNNDTVMQSFHMDGFSFYVVGMDYGVWTNGSRGQYNNWDAIFRSTVQVFPGAWTAILVYTDNVGVWNMRSGNLDRWYLGQETYVRLVDHEDKNAEFSPPKNVIYCGALRSKQHWAKSAAFSTHQNFRLLSTLLWAIFGAIFIHSV